MQNLPSTPVFPKAFASNPSDRETDIPASGSSSVNWTNGFPEIFSTLIKDGGRYVQRKDLNTILYALSNALCYQQQGGVVTWNSTLCTLITGYPVNARLWWNDGSQWNIIESQIGNNQIEPTTSTVDVKTDESGQPSASGTIKWKRVLLMQPDKCLPLAGGTMTGTIVSSVTPALSRSGTTGYAEIKGAEGFGTGAALQLAGEGYSGEDVPAGGFDLQAGGNGQTTILRGTPTGVLLWGNKSIVRSVNGVNADANGNISDGKTELFFNSSGHESGNIWLNQSWRNFKYLIVMGADDTKQMSHSNIIDVECMKMSVDYNRYFTIYSSVIDSYAIMGTPACFGNHWCVAPTSKGTTDTMLANGYPTGWTHGENCVIFAIYGVNCL